VIGVAIAIVVSIIAANALFLVARHAEVLVEIGLRTILLIAALLLPVAPFVVLAGAGRIGAIPSVILGVACCLPSLIIARKAIQILEREGTDRVNGAIEAMSHMMGGAIAMLTYVAIAGIFAITWQYYPG
jgi:hypothetical protein